MSNDERRLSGREIAVGIVSIVGWTLFGLIAPMSRDGFAGIFRGLGAPLPAITAFYLSCPGTVYLALASGFIVATLLALFNPGLRSRGWQRTTLRVCLVVLALSVFLFAIAVSLPLRQ